MLAPAEEPHHHHQQQQHAVPAHAMTREERQGLMMHDGTPRRRRHASFRFLLLLIPSVASVALLALLLLLPGQHHGGDGRHQQHQAPTSSGSYSALSIDRPAVRPSPERIPSLPFYRPDSVDPFNGQRRFVWEVGPADEDVISDKEPPARRARCRLRVEGDPSFASFDEYSPRAHRCLRNKSIVFVGDSITRCARVHDVLDLPCVPTPS